MTLVVPATECEVDPSHKGKGLVDDDDLLMVSPEEDARGEDLGMT